MKSILIVLMILSSTFIACNRIFQLYNPDPQEEQYQDVGTMTGYDARMCACCGGIFITIGGTQYIIDSMPENSGIDMTIEKLPLKVKLNWHRQAGGCESFNRIVVEKIRKL